MIRSIKQKLYLIGLLPLAVLALLVVLVNGYARIQDAEQQLREAQRLTVELLRGPAQDALVIGDTKTVQDQMNAVVTRSSRVQCLALWDAHSGLIASIGDCNEPAPLTDRFGVEVAAGGFSDLETATQRSRVGTLQVSMHRGAIAEKRRAVLWQALVSLLLVAAIAAWVARLLRTRLAKPIQEIDATMQAVSEGNYEARVTTRSRDELGRLATAINETIDKVRRNVADIERSRDAAMQALNDADAITLARDGLVEALVRDSIKPLATLHEHLTYIALDNSDPDLRQPIKEALQRLQETQQQLRELIEIATSPHTKPLPARRFVQLQEVIADVARGLHVNAKTEGYRVQWDAPVVATGEDFLVSLDEDRFKKAIVRLVATMGKRATAEGVNVHVQYARRSSHVLNITVYLKAFVQTGGLHEGGELLQYSTETPEGLQWTEREQREIDYLLGIIGAVKTYSVSPRGTIYVTIDLDCECSNGAIQISGGSDRLLGRKPLALCVVSNDESLQRLSGRGGLANHDLHLHDLDQAIASIQDFGKYDAVLIDLAGDIAGAVTLATELKKLPDGGPYLIAICPAGPLQAITQRLQTLGFTAFVQRPFDYARLLEVLPLTLRGPWQ